MPKLSILRESWPIKGSFTISRGSKSSADVVVVELTAGGMSGRGESVPYARYGETSEGVVAAIEGQRGPVGSGLDRAALQELLPPGAARNAIDCAMWDLDAKRAGRRAWELAGLAEPKPVVTAYTLSLDTVERVGEAAGANAERPLLKLKLTGEGDVERVAAVRERAPRARIITDANEAWTPEQFTEFSPRLRDLGVELIEQPFPAGKDAPLAELERPVPVCADESCHDTATLPALRGRYDMINIKLDKTGGLTEALKLAAAAESEGFQVMVGCMVATSLSMAPAMLIAQHAHVVDLDGPLLLAQDRPQGLRFEGSTAYPPDAGLWG